MGSSRAQNSMVRDQLGCGHIFVQLHTIHLAVQYVQFFYFPQRRNFAKTDKHQRYQREISAALIHLVGAPSTSPWDISFGATYLMFLRIKAQRLGSIRNLQDSNLLIYDGALVFLYVGFWCPWSALAFFLPCVSASKTKPSHTVHLNLISLAFSLNKKMIAHWFWNKQKIKQVELDFESLSAMTFILPRRIWMISSQALFRCRLYSWHFNWLVPFQKFAWSTW